MRKLSLLIVTVISVLIMSGCKKSKEMQQDDNFHPRIFDRTGVFTSPSRIINMGQSAIYNGLVFSPKPGEKSQIVWKLNGAQVSTDTTFTFTPTTGGEYEIKLEASYNGQVSTRISRVLVSPDTYTPKPFTNVVMGYVSENGRATDVDWTKTTHVVFNGARVINSTSIDYSKGNANQNIDELVARGHINGVPVLLGVSGRLSGVDGWSLYNSTDFGLSINSPAKRATLITNIAEYVASRKLDGVDIMMTDLGNDVYAVSAEMLQSVGPFLNELKAALPTSAIVTVTVTTNYLHWEYGNLSAANWLNVHAFEDGAIGPGAAKAQPSSLQHMINTANLWSTTKGYPKNKIVLGIPAFGLRYNELDANGNNLGWGSYGYSSYKDIVAADATAPQKEYSDKIAFGVYYNGLPLVNQKSDYIKAQGFKGAYIWAVDYDVKGENSLLNAVYNKLK